jgi:hypothetical protein
MKQAYNAFRFFLACALIFWSGYSFAKRRNDADKMFAPAFCGFGVYYLWRSSRNPPIPN